MATRRRKKSRKILKVVVILILVAVAAAIVFLVWDAYFNDTKPKETAGGTDVTVEVEKVEEEAKPSADKKEETETVQKEKVIQYEGDDPNEEKGLTGVITHAGVSGDFLMIRVNIDQYLSQGTCILTLRKDSENVYSDTANVIDAAATATCEGFNVPVAELPSGKMNIIIYVSSGEKSGEIHGEVEI